MALPASAGVPEGVALLNKQDYKAAMKEFEAEAAKDNSEAMYYIGEIFHRGLGMNPQRLTGIHWWEKAAYLRKHEDRYFSRGRPSFTVAQGSPLVHPAYLGSYEDFADYLLCLACYARKFDAIRFGDGSSEIRLSFSANSFLDEARKANTLDESNLSHLYLVIVYELGKAGFFKDEESLFEGYQRLLIRGRNLVTDIIRNETLASYERIVVETSLLDLKRIEENIARLERTGINDDSFKATVGSLLKCFADAGFSYARKQAD